MKKSLFMLIVVSVLFGCKKEEMSGELTVNQDEVSLHYDETFNFNLQVGGRNVSWGNVTPNVRDRTIGTINNSGEFSAKRVGTTTVTFRHQGSTVSSTVTVKPYQDFFTEPIARWGAYAQDIRDEEKREVLQSTPTLLEYLDTNNDDVRGVAYQFNANRLYRAIVFFRNHQDVLDNVLTFYRERHDPIQFSEDLNLMVFRGTHMNVGVQAPHPTLGLIAIYVDPNSDPTNSYSLHPDNNSELNLKKLDTDVEQEAIKQMLLK